MPLISEVTDSASPGLEAIFQECLGKFPELKDRNIQLKIVRTTDKLEGAKGQDESGEDVVVLWIPGRLWSLWQALKPIIYHELSHFVDLHNPDRIFYERADEKSQELWALLQEAKAVKCES